jgi:dethiobiotin synthetase
VGWPVGAAIVVAHPDLGMLNHTILTVNALKREGIPLAGVVINNWKGKTQAEKTNPGVLSRILNRRVIVIPHQPRLVSGLFNLL